MVAKKPVRKRQPVERDAFFVGIVQRLPERRRSAELVYRPTTTIDGVRRTGNFSLGDVAFCFHTPPILGNRRRNTRYLDAISTGWPNSIQRRDRQPVWSGPLRENRDRFTSPFDVGPISPVGFTTVRGGHGEDDIYTTLANYDSGGLAGPKLDDENITAARRQRPSDRSTGQEFGSDFRFLGNYSGGTQRHFENAQNEEPRGCSPANERTWRVNAQHGNSGVGGRGDDEGNVVWRVALLAET